MRERVILRWILMPLVEWVLAPILRIIKRGRPVPVTCGVLAGAAIGAIIVWAWLRQVAPGALSGDFDDMIPRVLVYFPLLPGAILGGLVSAVIAALLFKRPSEPVVEETLKMKKTAKTKKTPKTKKAQVTKSRKRR